MRHAIPPAIILLALTLSACEKPRAAPLQGQVELRPMESLAPAEPASPSEPKAREGTAPPPVRPAAVTTRPATPAPQPAPPQPAKYTVQRRDTLWSIAVRHLGDGKRWKDIQAFNTGLDPAKLNPGQIIMLPPK